MKIKNKKNWIITAAAVSAVAIGSAGAYYLKNRPAKDTDQSTTVTQQSPADEEKSSGDQAKDSLNRNNRQSLPTDASGKKTVTPIITSYGQVDGKVKVAARVPGVFEDGGLCTLTMIQGSAKSATASRKGSTNVSEVSCGFITIPRNQLSPGNWTATVSYSSATAKGTSDPVTIAVK